MPRVTVIIATYNWSTVLPYSIASVLAQTFTDFELLRPTFLVLPQGTWRGRGLRKDA